MAVAGIVTVTQRPWQGYSDPGLPVGMWVSQGTVLGDASGGNQSVIMRFKEEGDPLGARFYNIEQMEVHSTRQVGALRAGLLIENFDIISSTGLVNRQIHIAMQTDGITDSAMISGNMKVPIFMGRPTLVGVSSQLTARTLNTLNETWFFTAQGYIWEPRSLLVDGGLRRPLDSLYG